MNVPLAAVNTLADNGAMPRPLRSTPPGEHRPVLLEEVLTALSPQPGEVMVDATVGWGGHSVALLQAVGPTGRLIGTDLDADNLSRARLRLDTIGHPYSLHHGNFAGLASVVAGEGIEAVDGVLADLGMSSMQVDDPERGFSYVRDGPLDMRMDRSRGRTAAQLLAEISKDNLTQLLRDLGDEPEADRIAAAIVAARQSRPLERSTDLARVILQAVQGDQPWRLHPSRREWKTHPAARTFQVLRIAVNRELANLEALLRQLPALLKPGGRVAIISFHSGEDRLVKAALREGQRTGCFVDIAPEPLRATFAERTANPRSRSAKLRWARRPGP
jgi:16S rRNA (cytosine1402-N4)-methyltransferase